MKTNGNGHDRHRDDAPPRHLDEALGIILPAKHARGRLVRLGATLDAILSRHAYPPLVERLLAEALTLTALLGTLLKEADGQLTIQVQSKGGIVDLLVCDFRGGEMRGYVRHDPERLAEAPTTPSLFALFGRGHLAITFDQASSGERYQGIVPLEGASLAEAAESYFAQSEQIPSLVRLATGGDGAGGHVAGGMLIQHLPEGEEGRDRIHTRLDHPEWEHVRALGATLGPDELLDPALPLDEIAWRLFHEEAEIRATPVTRIRRGCRCNPEHFREVLSTFPLDEQREMAGDDGVIHVDCEFCSRRYAIPLASLAPDSDGHLAGRG